MSDDPRSPETTKLLDDPAGWADGVGGEGRDLPASRGFLGRFFGVFSGDEPADQPLPGQPTVAPCLLYTSPSPRD